MFSEIRRIITEYDENGKSIWSDKSFPLAQVESASGNRLTDLWRIAKCPPDVRDDDAPSTVENWPDKGGLIIRYVDMPPGSGRDSWQKGLHASDTVEISILIFGEVLAYLGDEKEPVLLRAGDVLVQRGTVHSWVNRSDEPCRFACILIDATRQP